MMPDQNPAPDVGGEASAENATMDDLFTAEEILGTFDVPGYEGEGIDADDDADEDTEGF